MLKHGWTDEQWQEVADTPWGRRALMNCAAYQKNEMPPEDMWDDYDPPQSWDRASISWFRHYGHAVRQDQLANP